MTKIDLRTGDCLDILRQMPDESVTAIVTDPPYALEFMGKGWDKVLPDVEVWRECLRVLKPGGMMLAFGGTRTFHRLTCTIEDAGFEIRDCLMWLYGSGFPKSLAIDKAIDRQRDDTGETLEVTRWICGAVRQSGIRHADILSAFGFNQGSGQVGHWTAVTVGSQPAVPTLEQVPKLLEVLGNPEVPERISRLLLDLNGKKGQPGPDWFRRAVTGTKNVPDARVTRPHFAAMCGDGAASRTVDITAPATDRSRPWAGYGTALKPAWEPIVLAMKPTDGTFAANALAHGVAGVNVDGCRIPAGDGYAENRVTQGGDHFSIGSEARTRGTTFEPSAAGRWPANVVLDDEAAGALDGQTEHKIHGAGAARSGSKNPRDSDYEATSYKIKNNTGDSGGASRFFYCAKASKKDRGSDNNHPTVKPTELMRWLVRMVKMPTGTVVLDPFMGSGSTGVACIAEGVDFIGMERDPEYVEIAKRRIEG